MSNTKVVVFHNIVVFMVTAGIWYVIFNKTGSMWSLLAFIIAAVFHQSYRETPVLKDGEKVAELPGHDE